MAVDLTASAKQYAIAQLKTIPGLGQRVYARKAPRRPTIPFATVRKSGEDGFDYIDDPGRPSNSIVRVELRATTDEECDELAALIDDALRDGGRVLDRTMYFEGVESDVRDENSSDTTYRLIVQYRITET